MKVLLIRANGQLGTDVNRIFQDAISNQTLRKYASDNQFVG